MFICMLNDYYDYNSYVVRCARFEYVVTTEVQKAVKSVEIVVIGVY